MKQHEIRSPKGARRKIRRLGRGISAGQGKTAGRGTKGQLARNGPGLPGWFEGGQTPIHMRIPKMRGFKNRFRTEYQGVNVGKLAAAFPQDGTVGIDELISAGLANKGELVKILGDGDLEGVKLNVTAHAFTGSAQEKITAAGGSATKLDR